MEVFCFRFLYLAHMIAECELAGTGLHRETQLTLFLLELMSFSLLDIARWKYHYSKDIRLVIVPLLLTNCCVKLLKNFVKSLRLVLLKISAIAFWNFKTSRRLARLLYLLGHFVYRIFPLNPNFRRCLFLPHQSPILLCCAFGTFSSINFLSAVLTFLDCFGFMD